MGYINSVLSNPAFQVFLIAMIGYIIGRIKIKGIEVGDAGILIVSLIAGHFGVTCPSFAKSIGIVLFVAYMPKSRDIQAKIPLPQAIWNEFWLRY